MTTKQDKEKTLRLHLVVKGLLCFKLQEMKEESGGMSLQDIIRVAILEKYDKLSKEKYGYKGAVSSQRKIAKQEGIEETDAQAEFLKNMTDEELNAHLIRIGYFQLDHTDIPNYPPNTILRDRIITNEFGRNYYQQQVDKDTGEIIYNRTVFNFDELIADLKREKKL